LKEGEDDDKSIDDDGLCTYEGLPPLSLPFPISFSLHALLVLAALPVKEEELLPWLNADDDREEDDAELSKLKILATAAPPREDKDDDDDDDDDEAPSSQAPPLPKPLSNTLTATITALLFSRKTFSNKLLP
jgi:hypothetical protein